MTMENTETSTLYLDELERQIDYNWYSETFEPEPIFISFKGYGLNDLRLGKHFYSDSKPNGIGEGTWDELKEGIETLLLSCRMTSAMITIPPGAIKVMDELEDMTKGTSRTVILLPQSCYDNGEATYIVGS